MKQQSKDLNKISRRTFLAAAAAATGAGLSPGRAATSPKRGGTLRVVAYANPSTLDPYTGRLGSDHTFLYPMFDTLISFDPQLRPIPGLATWAFSDPMTMVLDLKPDIRFHDGTPCDANAVKANLDRAMTSPRSTVKQDFAAVASVEVTGRLQVALRLKKPDSSLPLVLADRGGMMSSPAAVTALGDEHDRKPCGTGQFKFVSWADAEKVVMTRFDDYWRKDAVHLEGVVFRVMLDSSAGVRSLGAGEADFMWVVPPKLMPVLQRNSNLTVIKYPSTRTIILGFNMVRGPFKDLRLRQAVNHAIDKVGFARVTTDGTGEACNCLAPKEHWAYYKEAENFYPYDPARARELLAQAGYKDGCDIDFIYYADSEYTRRADLIMTMLQSVGFRIRPMSGPSAQAAQWMSEQKADMILTGWPGRPDMSSTYGLLLSKTSFYNSTHTSPIDNIEELIDDTRRTDNIDERAAAFARLIRAEREAAVLGPLCYEPVVYGSKASLKGFVPSLLGKPKLDGMYFEG